VQALKRTDIHTTLRAADALRTLLSERTSVRAAEAPRTPAPSTGGAARSADTPVRPSSSADPSPGTRIRVPVIAEGDDPGDGLRPACDVLRVLRLDPRETPEAEFLVRPFAWRLSGEGARRAQLEAGRIAVFSRERWRPREGACAVRVGGRLVLGEVMWNGRHLLLAPSAGASDFEVLDAPDEQAGARHVVGRLTALLDDTE